MSSLPPTRSGGSPFPSPAPRRGQLVSSPPSSLYFSDPHEHLPPEVLRSALRHSLSPSLTTTTFGIPASGQIPRSTSASGSAFPAAPETQPDPVEEEEEEGEEEEEEEEDHGLLSICYSNGLLGAALYNLESATLLVMEDLLEQSPEFKVSTALLRQCNPKHLLVHEKVDKNLRKRVLELCGYPAEEEAPPEEDEGDEVSAASLSGGQRATATGEVTPGGLTTLPSTTSGATTETRDSALRNTEITFLSGKEFEFVSCKRRILNLQFAQEDAGSSEEDHFLFINSLFNLGGDLSVRATGALLKYLDHSKITGLNLSNPEGLGNPFLVLTVQSLHVDEILTIDETSLTALQIFNTSCQNAGSKFGSWNKNREGLSLFNVLNKCKSILGSKYLKYMCRCPLRSVSSIEQRQDVVAYFSSPNNIDLLKSLQDCLKNVKNVPKMLKKLATTQATVRDWKCLKKTVMSLSIITEVCGQQRSREEISLMSKLAECSTQELLSVGDLIERVFDIEMSQAQGKFAVNAGIDDELDEKRKVHNGMTDLLLKVALEEINELPEYMTQCSMTYVPKIGYMLAIQPWAEELSEENFDFPNLEYMFMADEVPHFKTQRCRELDECLGDTATIISDHETGIMLKLANYILSLSEHILRPARYSALLDCLLSLAQVALENNWTRPLVGEGQVMKIRGGRHPLQEICTTTFVSNPTCLGDPESGVKVAILTGPNACGKSVYLKQVGLIVFLAHIGSYVPADFAQVPSVDRIFTRIQTVDSLSLGLSAFMVDLNQMSSALRQSTKDSLILVDEFGKGTSDVDGQSLLAASIQSFASRGTDSPFVLVTTHFHGIKALLEKGLPIVYNTFEYVYNGPDIVFLYKLKAGKSSTSQAHQVAKSAGIEEDIIKRSFEINTCVTQGEEINSRGDLYPLESIQNLSEKFMELDMANHNEVDDFLLSLNEIEL